MSTQALSPTSTFVPHIPDFTESFFETEKIPLKDDPSTPHSPSTSPHPTEGPIHLQILDTQLSTEELQNYRKFSAECLAHQYHPSAFGIICPAHPEAKHPYPGQMPENPHEDKKIFHQFILRGMSKKFRELERNFNNDFRHWQAQMKDHLNEIPLLKAKDALFKSFVSLVQTNYHDAALEAQDALNHNSFNPTAYALLAVLAYEQGEIQQAMRYEEKLSQIQPALPLGEVGQRLIHEMVQENLSALYVKTCEDAGKALMKQTGAIPLEKDYLQLQVQRNLWENIQQSKAQDQFDYLDLISLYFLEETLFEESSKEVNTFMDGSFKYIVQLFEHVSVNLDLIKAHSINISPALQEVLDAKSLNKEQLSLLIKELSKPLNEGNAQLKRKFMYHAMQIQLYRKLFEAGAHRL